MRSNMGRKEYVMIDKGKKSAIMLAVVLILVGTFFYAVYRLAVERGGL